MMTVSTNCMCNTAKTPSIYIHVYIYIYIYVYIYIFTL